jgi:hypothetical protein
MKLRTPLFYFVGIMMSGLFPVGCTKKSSTTPKSTTSGNFWFGNIIGTNNIVGPGNALLLRTDGTMREYANDYYSQGTTMGPSDTAIAKVKLDGTWYSTVNNGQTTINTTWYQPVGATTYATVGLVSGNSMTGSFDDVAAGGSTAATFKFTNSN